MFGIVRTAARYLPGGLLLLVLLLGGCAAPPQSQHLLKTPPPKLAHPVLLTDVPFYPQQIHQCGPAALATVLNWSGVALTPEALVPEVYVPERKGSLQVELLAAARRHGRIAYVLRPKLDDVLAEVHAGRPVLVLQNLGLSWYPRWHYAVVVGYDLQADRLTLRSGDEAMHTETLELFERTWNRGHDWAVVVLRPGQMPVHAEPLRYLQAVVGFERLGDWRAAEASYRAALDRWPHDIAAAMGLGNSYYAQGQLKKAAEQYRAVVRAHRDYAPALNNLAQTLADLGRWEAAEPYARRAAELGGPQADTYRQTLQSIRAHRSQ